VKRVDELTGASKNVTLALAHRKGEQPLVSTIERIPFAPTGLTILTIDSSMFFPAQSMKKNKKQPKTDTPTKRDSVQQPSPSTVAVSDSLDAAIHLYAAGQYAAAFQHIERLLLERPDDIAALHIATACLGSMGRLAEAEDCCRRILIVQPNHLGAHNNLGVLLKKQHRLDEAEASYRHVVALQPDHADTHNNLGNLLREQGRFAEAQASYCQSLALQPDHVDAHNSLGTLLRQQGQLEAAAQHYRQALSVRPGAADLHHNLGVLLKEQGLLAEAEASYRRALTLQPKLAGTHQSLGGVLNAQGRFDEAEASYARALALQPDYVEALDNLGSLLHVQQRFAEAEASYRRILKLQPNHASSLNNLGIVLKEQDRFAEAETSYRHALALRPDSAEVHNNLGNLLRAQDRFAEAEEQYCRALTLQPDYADAERNFFILLKKQKRFPEAEACCHRLLALQPDSHETYNDLAILLSEHNRLDEAEALYQHALTLQPHFAESYNNLSLLYRRQNRFVEAEHACRHALSLRPDFANATWNLSLLLLFLARFEEGWLLYEARYDPNRENPPIIAPKAPYPQWQGEDLRGKSILVWPEQGSGDEIQFVRYLPLLKGLGASHVTLVCKPSVGTLFTNIPGVDQVIAGAPGTITIPPHDFWTLLLSLPFRFHTNLTNIPATLPYLSADEKRIKAWQTKRAWAPVSPAATSPANGGMSAAPTFTVGLAWKGSATHNNDAYRSLPSLQLLKPLWSIPGISFISLQKGNGEDEAAHPPPDQPLLHLGSEIENFADTAALITQLDLVISVDTAVVHLAGALGKPCWVLLPCVGTDWRWMADRSDSPWYPGVMRLFRQQRVGDWESVISEVTTALRQMSKVSKPA
jgi:Flp pilus assembly protein TadD